MLTNCDRFRFVFALCSKSFPRTHKHTNSLMGSAGARSVMNYLYYSKKGKNNLHGGKLACSAYTPLPHSGLKRSVNLIYQNVMRIFVDFWKCYRIHPHVSRSVATLIPPSRTKLLERAL
jgi:hypothetical protein